MTAFERGGRLSDQAALVAEIAPDRIVLVRKHLFHQHEIVLAADWVDRIDVVDSTRSGALFGAAVGGALGIAELLQTHRERRSRSDCNLCPLGYLFGGILPLIGAGIGGAVDALTTERIYERPVQKSPITLVPLIDRQHLGIGAAIRY